MSDRSAFAQEMFDIVRDRQRKRSRRQKIRAALGKVLGTLCLVATRWLLGGLMFMLAVGVIHHEWIPALPTLGFWWSVLVSALLRSALASTAAASRKPTSPQPNPGR